MNVIERPLRAVDRFQRRYPVLAFPVAVWTKFNDDQAGNLAALIAYYGFAALFPLLLVLATVLNIVLADDPGLQKELLNSALAQYPVIGQHITSNLGHITGTGLPLAIGAVLLVLGARGVAGAMQNALCEVWGIPKEERPGFPMSQLWAMLLMFTIGIGFIVTTFLSGLAGGAGHLISGAGAYVGTVAVSLVLNVGMFWLSFRIATVFKIPWRDLRTGAAIAAVCWTVLQLVGGYVVNHQLHRASELYGTFGIVLGLLAWLYLQAEVTLYAAEADVVLSRRLWPKSVVPGEAAAAGDAEKGDVAKENAATEHAAGDARQAAYQDEVPQSRGKHARPEEPSSLEVQPRYNGEAAAGDRNSVPSPRGEPADSDKRAAGQR